MRGRGCTSSTTSPRPSWTRPTPRSPLPRSTCTTRRTGRGRRRRLLLDAGRHRMDYFHGLLLRIARAAPMPCGRRCRLRTRCCSCAADMQAVSDAMTATLALAARFRAVRGKLDSEVGRARAGRDAACWQDQAQACPALRLGWTLRARAREEEQRSQRVAARLDRVRSALTQAVKADVEASVNVYAV